VAVVALNIASACEPNPPRTQAFDNGYRASVLTYHGPGGYRYQRPDASLLEVSRPAGLGGNFWLAITDESAPASIDQESCVTWHGPMVSNSQPGVVLRTHAQGDRVRAVMITNNIMYGVRNALHVHLVDTSNPSEPLSMLAGGTVNTVGRSLQTHPLPWRICGRVIGDQVSLKAWSTQLAEPSWDGTDDVIRLTLPDAFVYAGQPGIYAGHLPNGSVSQYRDHAT